VFELILREKGGYRAGLHASYTRKCVLFVHKLVLVKPISLKFFSKGNRSLYYWLYV